MSVIVSEEQTIIVSEANAAEVVTQVYSGIVQSPVVESIESKESVSEIVQSSPAQVIESCRVVLVTGAPPPDKVVTLIASTDWTTVNAVLSVDNGSATWQVQCEDEGTDSRLSEIVSAVHNGVVSIPTEVHWTVFGKMIFGSLGIEARVILELVGGVQYMLLQVKAPINARVTVWRL